jgi:hypothetical protein
MNHDVRSAALRAAAKVALSVGVLGGCGGSVANEPKGPYEPEPARSNYPATGGAGGAGADRAEPCEDAPTPAPTKPACDGVLASAFADPAWDDWQPWGWPPVDPPPVSEDVKACCEEELASADGINSEHRFQCCGVVGYGRDGVELDPAVSMACTPWGPPVPPAMRRRARGVA